MAPRLDPRVLLAIGLGACKPVADAARTPPVDTDPSADTDVADTDTDVADTDPADTDVTPRPGKKCLSKIIIDDDLLCLSDLPRAPVPETEMMVCLKGPMTDEQRRELYRQMMEDRESRAPDDVRQEVIDRGVLPEDVAELLRKRREQA